MAKKDPPLSQPADFVRALLHGGFIMVQHGYGWIKQVHQCIPDNQFSFHNVNANRALCMSGQVDDVWLDLCGVVCGLVLTTVVAFMRNTDRGKIR